MQKRINEKLIEVEAPYGCMGVGKSTHPFEICLKLKEIFWEFS